MHAVCQTLEYQCILFIQYTCIEHLLFNTALEVPSTRSTDMYHSCIHSFVHYACIEHLHVLGAWPSRYHHSFIHPFTTHGLNACCLLGTGLCPRLQQGTRQSVSDFMELSFAFLLLHPYTGPSQQPLGRGYFHFLFTNEHSEG